MIKILKERSGSGYVRACVMILVLSIILSAVFFYAETVKQIQVCRENMQLILDRYVLRHSVEIYAAVKRGSNVLTEDIQSEIVKDLCETELSLTDTGTELLSADENGQPAGRMSYPKLTVTEENLLCLRADCVLTIPVLFAGEKLTDMRIPLHAESRFVRK